MPGSVLLIVLFAAFIHAAWNAVVKGAGDRTITFGLVLLGQTLPALFFLPFLPFPPKEALPFLFISVLLHWSYYYFLVQAYRFGDLSLVYPIARGLTPLLVALGSLIFVGEVLPRNGWLGLALISGGILILAVSALIKDRSLTGLHLAVLTAVLVASYSIVDGLGVRQSDEAMSYIGWLFVLEGTGVIFILAPRFKRLQQLSRQAILTGIMGGGLAALAYGLVLYAKTVAPIGMVSALRETSVVFAALIGLFLFGEGPAKIRLLAALIVAFGILFLASAGCDGNLTSCP